MFAIKIPRKLILGFALIILSFNSQAHDGHKKDIIETAIYGGIFKTFISAIKAADFEIPKFGDDVISIGYPGIGVTYDKPTITQGIISKVFNDDVGVFMTTAAINSGNSGGPIFNLKGNLVGVTFAKLAKLKYLISEEVEIFF